MTTTMDADGHPHAPPSHESDKASAALAAQRARTQLSWLAIFRIGLVQTALGAIVVLTTSTLNRVMVVELLLPAVLPGALVGLHYGVQVMRPRWGYGADRGGHHTPWIIGGMALLALGGVLAALATALMGVHLYAGVGLAILAFVLIGVGVGASGTNLLVFLSRYADRARLPAAATMVWVMMIIGFIITAASAGSALDPFSTTRLVIVTTVVSAVAFTIAVLAVYGIEQRLLRAAREAPAALSARATAAKAPPDFRAALRQVWAEPDARHFTIFVFVSMLAYAAQDLILEPFGGIAFGMTPGETTKLAGVQNSGVLAGMIAVAAIATLARGTWLGSLKLWTVIGCVGSAAALFSLGAAGAFAPAWPLPLSVAALGFANGAFAVAAIASMMALAAGKPGAKERRDGTRMGLWGAAQAIAFGSGGFVGALGVDIVRAATGEAVLAYMAVFIVEGCLFLAAALIALNIGRERATREQLAQAPNLMRVGETMLPAENRQT
ncbi:MAG: BCD family MFS transporter [Pseudomonadota bacterium]